MPPQTESMSVIIPFYNAAGTLKECLTAVAAAISAGDEVILVDDGSSDQGGEIAKSFPFKYIKLDSNQGAAAARNQGSAKAFNDILVFMDADIVINKSHLDQVRTYLASHQEVAAVFGTLDAPVSQSFISDYKNLYMQFVLATTPQQANFIYGSFCAIRQANFIPWPQGIFYVEDSAWGYELSLEKQKIHLLHDLRVKHLKEYTLAGLLKNDFRVASSFADLFIRYRRWKTAYAKEKFGHTSKIQVLSLALANLATIAAMLGTRHVIPLLMLWFFTSIPFIWFLARHRGFMFAGKATLVTYLDHHAYLSGMLTGFVKASRKNGRP